MLDYMLYMKVFPPMVWSMIFASMLTYALGFLVIAMSRTNHFHEFSNSESFGVSNSVALSVMLLIQNQEYKVRTLQINSCPCLLPVWQHGELPHLMVLLV